MSERVADRPPRKDAMNKDRRKAIADAVEQLNSALQIIEDARDEEQDYLDNMPENWQEGEKGEAARAAIDSLTEAADAITEAVSAAETGSE